MHISQSQCLYIINIVRLDRLSQINLYSQFVPRFSFSRVQVTIKMRFMRIYCIFCIFVALIDSLTYVFIFTCKQRCFSRACLLTHSLYVRFDQIWKNGSLVESGTGYWIENMGHNAAFVMRAQYAASNPLSRWITVEIYYDIFRRCIYKIDRPPIISSALQNVILCLKSIGDTRWSEFISGINWFLMVYEILSSSLVLTCVLLFYWSIYLTFCNVCYYVYFSFIFVYLLISQSVIFLGVFKIFFFSISQSIDGTD